jgi:putative Mg2+ transporter-C (MgtC) family protein
MGLPLASSLLTGMLIGLDRELQGKPAGLRTHALVCFASTLLTLAAAHQGRWELGLQPSTQIVSDPTRMAHGILTGIGFLGAGVIFREGPSVHGLTTAASLWITAALGIIFGVGMFGLAVVGALATLVVLVALRFLYSALPRSSGLHLTITVDAASRFNVATVRELLRTHSLPDQPLSQSYDRQRNVLEFTTSTYSRNMERCDHLADALKSNSAVLGFRMLLVEDAGARDTVG